MYAIFRLGNHLEDQGVGGKIILEHILRGWGGNVWSGFIWLWKWTSDVLLWTR